MAEVRSFRGERAKTFQEEVLTMEEVRKKLQGRGIDRAFAPGRFRRQGLTATYERLVPIRRFACGQPAQSSSHHEVREGRLCAW